MADDDESGAGCNVCMMNCAQPENLFGFKKYSYKYLCMPVWNPWCQKEGAPAPKFFGKDEKLPLLLSLVLGFQHALAMLAGIATSGGYLITNDTGFAWQKDSQMYGRMPWMISCAWLTSGILTIIQVFRAKVKGTPFYLGTGLISVMGTSFTFLPIARTMTLDAIFEAKSSWPTCATDANGAPIFTGDCCFGGDCYGAGAIGYGKFLGTALVASLFEIVFSFTPPRIMKKLFPPVVTGAAIMLIGGSLIGAGVKYVGGGVFCAENTESRVMTFSSPQLCFGDNGEVAMSFGSADYVGLAMVVILGSILFQTFGSPFLKSTFLIWSLILGCIAAAPGKDINGDGVAESYFRKDFLEKAGAKPISFLWSEGTYPIGFSGPDFLPILIGFVISSAETIGDVAMTCVYSGVEEADDIASRVQGGLLADGVNSFLACLFGSPPNTTFSQNNGLIALTRCASRSAGFSCAFWLIIFGIISPFGMLFASIPICVIGGLVLQCFAAVFVSGMKLATTDFTRRNQYILMLALGIGLGVAMEGHIVDWPGPYTFVRRNLAYDFGFWPEKYVCDTPNAGAIDVASGLCISPTRAPFSNNGGCCSSYNVSGKAWRKTILAVLKTPYAIGFVIAFVLNVVLPEDAIDPETQLPEKKESGSTTTVSSA